MLVVHQLFANGTLLALMVGALMVTNGRLMHDQFAKGTPLFRQKIING